jgi:hypothetical protein
VLLLIVAFACLLSSIMSKIKEIDEKQQPGYVLGSEVDESSSLDTITALVAEGRKQVSMEGCFPGAALF